MSKKNPVDLGIPTAIWLSLRGKATDFYPRVKSGDEPSETLKTRAIMDEFIAAAKTWEDVPANPDLDTAIGLARQSLNEVKAQTEYQDQKAGRLLTVATILSALAALLFQRFSDAFPLLATVRSTAPAKYLILFAYVPFVLFVFAVLFGALVTFHATRTRFKYDQEEADKQEKAAGDNDPHSRLFYAGMLRARPRAWASSFVVEQQTGIKKSLVLNPALRKLYFRDLVGESYLVAAKTADKIRFLIEAQRLFAWALVFLLVWLLMFLVVSFVPSTKPDADPTIVRLERETAVGTGASVRIEQQRPIEVHALVESARAKGARSDAGQRNTQ